MVREIVREGWMLLVYIMGQTAAVSLAGQGAVATGWCGARSGGCATAGRGRWGFWLGAGAARWRGGLASCWQGRGVCWRRLLLELVR